VWGFPSRSSQHLFVEIDSHDLNSAPVELDCDPASSTTRIKYRMRTIRVNEVSFSVDVLTGFG
jgi:hypothetical protein